MNYELACITGATSGLGRQVAKELAQKGIPLLLCSRKHFDLEKLQLELLPLTKVDIIAADLEKSCDIDLLTRTIALRVPDLVINAAGLGLYGDALSFPVADQLSILQVNLCAATHITLASAKALMAAKKKGTIVNIGSMAGHFLYPRFALYAASKRALEDLSLSLDEEWKLLGVRVLVALPGRFASPFLSKSHRSIPPSSWSIIPLQKVAKCLLKQIQSQKSRSIIDGRYLLLSALALLLPKRWIAKFL